VRKLQKEAGRNKKTEIQILREKTLNCIANIADYK